MKFSLVVAALCLPVTAYAQAQSSFVPYTVGQAEHQWLMNKLGDVPLRYSLEITQALTQLEAQAQKAVADAKKPIEQKAAPAE